MKLRSVFIYLMFYCSCNSFGQTLELNKVLEKGKAIFNADFNYTGKTIAMSDGKQIKVFSTDSSELLYTHNIETLTLDNACNSDLLACGSKTGQVLLFERDIPVRNFQAYQTKITGVKFSHSDKLLATCSSENILKIWSLDAQSSMAEITCPDGDVTDFEFTLDDSFILFSSSKGSVFTWDIANNCIIKTYKVHRGYVRSVAVSPDGLRFASCGDDRKIVIYTLKEQEHYVLAGSHHQRIMDIRFINCNYLLSIGQDHRMVLNNIHLLNENNSGVFAKRNFHYGIKLNAISGDKYPSAISVSGEMQSIAVATLGKGVLISEYFYRFIKESHIIEMYGIDNTLTGGQLTKLGLLKTKNMACTFSLKISRPESIENIWMCFAGDERKIKIHIDKEGNFKKDFVLKDKLTDFDIIIEDADHQLDALKYSFRIVKD
jgi:WD40 repeat protein